MHDDHARFAGYLRPGEELLWTGRPPTNLLVTSRDVVFIPLGIGCAIWMLVMIALNWHGLRGAPFLEVLYDSHMEIVAFVGFLYLGVGRLWLERRVRRHTVYGVTNDRALVVRKAAVTEVLLYERLNRHTRMIDYGGDIGSFYFSPELTAVDTMRHSQRHRMVFLHPAMTPDVEFIKITGYARVAALTKRPTGEEIVLAIV